ncbi:MAG: hypothetical protein V1803_02445 [Candidatus Roizmanbacteria bacterium]
MITPMTSETLRPELSITPDFLRIDNSSRKATLNRTEWRKAKEAKNGQITLFIVCGDSRIVTADIADDNKIVSISSIASSGDLKPFKKLFEHQMIGQIVVVGHFDHKKIDPVKKKVKGCGGEDASEKIEDGEIVIENEPLNTYVTQRVSKNFFENIKRTVEQAAALSEKPVLGVMVDHLTNAAFPMIEVNKGKELMYPEKDLEGFQWKTIDDVQKFINNYGDYFPQLRSADLSDVFREFIEKNRIKAKQRIENDPGFIERQRVQNPSTVVISTCPIPLALRFPDSFGHPNEAFVIRKAFSKEGKTIKATEIDFMSIVGQLYYPLKQADFPRTNNILIETPDLEMSAQIADRLLKISFVQDWIKRKQGKIMIAELKHHETKKIQYYSSGNISS